MDYRLSGIAALYDTIISLLSGILLVLFHMHHLHHAKSVGYVHAELCGELQPGLVDMAVIGFLCNSAGITANFPGKRRRGIHIEKHPRVSMAHLLHVFFPHHIHSAFVHAVEHDFHISESLQHPQKDKHFFLFKIVEQTAGRNQQWRIRCIDTNLPDPAI